MPAWFLNPALTRFRTEVNNRWPKRDKTSDGTIGDAAHQATSSDHNPDKDGSVDAWDMDNNGVDVNAVIAAAIKHESIAYIIWNRRITSRNQAGGLGTWHPYSGVSPHTEHVHFNTREGFENSTKPWFTTPQEGTVMADTPLVMDMGWRLDALMRGQTKTAGGPSKGQDVWLVNQVNAINKTLAALGTALSATMNDADKAEVLAAIKSAAEADAGRDVAQDAVLASMPEQIRDAIATGDPSDLAQLLENAMLPGAWVEFKAAVDAA